MVFAQVFVDCCLEVKILYDAHTITRLTLRVRLVLWLVWVIAVGNNKEKENKC